MDSAGELLLLTNSSTLSIAFNDVIMHHTFSFLEGSDLKQCRLVCRKWRDVSSLTFKKKSLIRFTDVGLHTIQNFLKTFKNVSTEIPFSGVFFDDLPEQWGDATNIEFLKKFANQITYFKANSLVSKFYLSHFINLRNILYDHLTNLEVLLLHLKVGTDTFEVLTSKDKEEIDTMNALKKTRFSRLQKFKFCFDVVVRNAVKPWVEKILSTFISEIIICAKNLNVLGIHGNPLSTAILKCLPADSVATLKELVLCLYFIQYHGEFRSVLENLTTLKSKGLRLESLTVICGTKYDDNDASTLFSPLMPFLNSQTECLTRLKLVWPTHLFVTTYVGPRLSKEMEFFHQLNEMKNLESLEMCYNPHFSFLMFQPDFCVKNTAFLTRLPKLKQLIFKHCRSDSHLFPLLLEKMMVTTNESVETVRVFPHFKRGVNSNEMLKLFEIAKSKFLGLKILEIFDAPTNHMLRYDGKDVVEFLYSDKSEHEEIKESDLDFTFTYTESEADDSPSTMDELELENDSSDSYDNDSSESDTDSESDDTDSDDSDAPADSNQGSGEDNTKECAPEIDSNKNLASGDTSKG